MKLILSFMLLGAFVVYPVSAQMNYANMGVLTNGISNTKSKDYSVAFEILIREIAAKQNMTGKMISYNRSGKIVHDFLLHKLDYIMINPYYFLKYHNSLEKDVAVYWSVRKADSKFEQMIVLVNKDKFHGKLSALKDKRVSMKDDNYMGRVVLDKALLESDVHHSYHNYIKELSSVKTHSRAILQLYFEKTDAAVVPKYAYDLMREMNPAIEKKLKIIYRTDSIFVPFMTMINKKTSPEIITTIIKGSASLPYTQNGKNILTLLKMRGLDKLMYKELSGLINYYDEYKELQKRYGSEK